MSIETVNDSNSARLWGKMANRANASRVLVPASEPGITKTPISTGVTPLETLIESTAADNREALGFADWVLLAAGAAVVLELITKQHGFAAGLVLFGGLLRLKLLLLDRLDARIPDWVIFERA